MLIFFKEMSRQINICENGLRTWALLAALESNSILECIKTGENSDRASKPGILDQNSALLLEIARRHLGELGKRLFLIAGKPNRDDIEEILDGFSQDCPESELASTEKNQETSQVVKVRRALSSPEAFEALYLELSELAMASFKTLDRDRSAAIIGKLA